MREGQGITEQYAKEMQALEQIGDQAFNRIGSAITQMSVEGQDAMKALNNVGQAVVSELLQAFIRLGTINPLKNAILGGDRATLSGVGGLIGDLIGSAGASAATTGAAVPTSAGGLGQPLPTFADGGITNGPSIAGERGPEAVVPLPNGRQIPVQMQGSGDMNVYIEPPAGHEAQTQRQSNGNGQESLYVTFVKMGRQAISEGAWDKPLRIRHGLNPQTRGA
jgi:hypothetical protein